jgi:hypothetical protein
LTRSLALELLVLTLLAAAGAAALPLAAGEFAWSWDALNHHIYLGLTAEQSRWELDVIPASYQTYQYPYLYWPIYRLSLLDLSCAAVGALWSGGQAALLLPPVWWISWRLLPASGSALPSWLERSLACALAFMSLVILSSLETTANDLLAAVPMLWALALWFHPDRSLGRCASAAALLGCAMAFKLSNALFLPLLLVWWWAPGEGLSTAWRRAVAMGLGVCLGFGLAYGPWGWQLWQHTGNPFYPFLSAYFGRG